MKVKILKSRDQLMWYADLIGTEWKVIRSEEDLHWVRDKQGYLNIIYKSDCELT